jgi:PAS domain S-box-containing protein
VGLLIASLEASNLAHTIALAGDDLPLTYVNQAFLDLTGYSRDEVIGRNCRFLTGPQTDPEASRRISASLRRGEGLEIDLVNHRKDGSPFLNHLYIAPVLNGAGRTVAFIGIQSDISRLRQRLIHEQQVEHLVALGRSVSRISHEIKNALQPVRLMAETLTNWRELAEADRGRCLDVLAQGVMVALGVTDDILNTVRQGGPEGDPIRIGDLAGQCGSFLSGLLHAGIHLDWADPVPALAPRTVTIRPRHLFQVLSNLAANAMDAMGGDGTLSVRWEAESLAVGPATDLSLVPGPYLRIDVTDTGTGMDAITLSRLFDSFITTKPRGEGTGLGLMISRAIIREAGGTITASSTPGQGSLFTIRLPINPCI